jgi:hypothetical protein
MIPTSERKDGCARYITARARRINQEILGRIRKNTVKNRSRKMPKKVTKKQVERIVFLRDSKEYTWNKIGEEIGLSSKTCKQHYVILKDRQDTRWEGKTHSEAFKIFSEGGGVFDGVQKLQLTIEEAELLYRKYIEHSKKQNEPTLDNRSSIFTEYEVMKKQGELQQNCEEKQFFIKECLGDIPQGKKDLIERAR